MNDKETTIEDIKQSIKKFVDDRDWEQYHLPKDLAIALVIEVGEILEHFRFKTDKEIQEFLKNPKNKEELSDELADTFYFLVALARMCDIDLSKASERKMAKAEKKYPKELVRGKPHKYTYYEKN